MMKNTINDRRSCSDRRKFTYTSYVPERRSGVDRRAAKPAEIKEKVA